jgi:hypothetical protein
MFKALRRLVKLRRQRAIRSLTYDLSAHEAKGFLLQKWLFRPGPAEAGDATPLRASEDHELSIDHLLSARSSLCVPDGRTLSYACFGAPLNDLTQQPLRVVLYLHGGFSSRIEPVLLGSEAEALVSKYVMSDMPALL